MSEPLELGYAIGMRRGTKRQVANDATPDERALRLGELAYREVLDGLFDRRLKAGTFISQADLVKQLGVSVQPLRDALRVLEAEGILKIHPGSGVEFLKADMELARHTYQFRSVIERVAARTYAETASMEEIEALLTDHEALIRAIEGGTDEGSPAQAMESLEERLHGGMIDSMRNPLVETTFKRLKNYLTLIKLAQPMTRPLVLRTLREHLEILKACRARDADAAEAALVRHLQAAVQRIMGIA